MELTKVYKPEIKTCPLCGAKLKYRYTVSNKVITFTNGKKIRIKNLGYSCTNENCLDNTEIYVSQTAVKLCMKGYTYSAKILAEIAILKHKKISRDMICNRLALSGVEISDRNIDIIYQKYEQILNRDYRQELAKQYKEMIEKYKQIRLSIDSILYDTYRVITVRNSFNNEIIGNHIMDENDSEGHKQLLVEYINNPYVKEIITTRKTTDFYKKLISSLSHEVKVISFEKF